MKIMKDGDPKMVELWEELPSMGIDFRIVRLDDNKIRELIVYLKKNRPELICPIMCEDCPEHLAQVESHNQCYNVRERGK